MCHNMREKEKRWIFQDRDYLRTRLTLTIGADDPSDLEHEDVFREVAELARRLGFSKMNGKSLVAVFGQNELAQRKFYYKK